MYKQDFSQLLFNFPDFHNWLYLYNHIYKRYNGSTNKSFAAQFTESKGKDQENEELPTVGEDHV